MRDPFDSLPPICRVNRQPPDDVMAQGAMAFDEYNSPGISSASTKAGKKSDARIRTPAKTRWVLQKKNYLSSLDKRSKGQLTAIRAAIRNGQNTPEIITRQEEAGIGNVQREG